MRQNRGMPAPLFLDCDPGIDDAIALGYLLCREAAGDVSIAGLAASAGNVAVGQVVRNALGWLALAGRPDIAVHAGSATPLAAGAPAEPDPATAEYADVTHGDTGAGYARLPESTAIPSGVSAAQAWVDAARAHPGELIGVLIGPATNLALALEIEPELPKLVKRLFIMGGAFNYRGNTQPTTEWNAAWDPEATQRVIAVFGKACTTGEAPHPPVLGPLEATERVELRPERLAAVLEGARAQADPRWVAWVEQLAEALRFYFEFHESDGHGYLAHIHDPFVTAVAVEWAIAGSSDAHLRWAETALAPVDVELTGTLTRGETVADWLGRWGRPANAEIIRSVDAEGFLDHLSATLQKGPQHADYR